LLASHRATLHDFIALSYGSARALEYDRRRGFRAKLNESLSEGLYVYYEGLSEGFGGWASCCFCDWEKWERNPAFGELSAQMLGKGVEHTSRVTCKTRRKDASTEQPKNGRRCWLSVKSAMKADWVKSHPRL
jgi:hypothetical protein